MRIKALLQKHTLGAYFLMAFSIAWVGSFLVVGPKYVRGEALTFSDTLAAAGPMLIGPSLSCLGLTAFLDGKEGLRELLSRMTRSNVGARWFSPLLIFPALILLVAATLGALVSPELAPTFFAFGLVIGLLAGIVEETGWMGYAYPRMQRGRNLLRTSVYLGLIHAFWHLPADFLINSAIYGQNWLAYFLGFSAFILGLRVLIVWVYANTRSLLLAQLMHASSTGFLAVIVPMGISATNWSVFYWVYAAGLGIIGAIVVRRYGADFVRRSSPGG